jgi:Rad52/22 family double-strand break repair protein
MSAKQAAEPGAETRHEWEAFLALSEMMDLSALDTNVYSRLEKACERLADQSLITRDALILESGLSFFDECAAPDLALMSLVRRGILKPISAQPFHFIIDPLSEVTPAPAERQSITHSSEDHFMQQIQFSTETPPSSPVLLPNGTVRETQDTEVAELPSEVAERLKQPLPAEAISSHPNKPGLSSVKAIYIIERLNEVFGLNGWEDDYEVIENGPMVVVRGCLRIPKHGIVRQQYGGNDNPDRGDAYKGACTDALTKCASQIGVAIDVYKGLGPGTSPPPSPPAPEADTRSGDAVDLRPESADDRTHRFREMERVLGTDAYLDVFSRYGYYAEPETLAVEQARHIYCDLLRVLRGRFERLRQQVDKPNYRRLLCSLRISPNAKLNAEQLIRVFEALWKVIDVQH